MCDSNFCPDCGHVLKTPAVEDWTMGQVREFFERLNLPAAAKQVKQNGKTLLRFSNGKMM